MTEPLGSVNFTALILAVNGPAAIGQALVFDSTQGTWLIATAANRTALGKRAEAIAITAYGGSSVGKIAYRSSGLLANELSLLGNGSASWVRVKSDGYLERCTPGVGDDLVGKCQTDGRLILTMNTWDSTNIVSGASPGGSNGDLQYRVNSTTFGGITGANGDVAYKSGGVWGTTPGILVPSGSNNDVVGLDGTGGLKNLGPMAGGGAPTNAQYLTLATDATLSQERVATASSTVGITDAGAGSTATFAVISGSLTNTHINASAGIVYSKLSLTGGIVNADINASAGIVGSKIAATSTQVAYGSGGVLAFSSNFTHDGSGNIAASSSIGLGGGTQHTTARIRFPYNSGSAVVLIGVKDSGATDRSALTFGAGDGLTFGNTSMNYTALGVDGQVSMTSSWQMTVNSTNRITAPVAENLALFGSTSSVPASLTRMVFIGNSAAAPTTLTGSPTGGGLLYAEAGAGRWQGTSGTRTTFGPAEPHCKKCGRDFAHEWENIISNEYLMVCVPCMLFAIERLGADLNEFTERRLAA